ncbi:L-glutamate gamma-semialdehyde dehydrogenase [Streptomonospora nanhaiensis]|uniref:L-glutamate gamma-semialdehyde dehydrogenase n=1 Tax=Streptomonospora nanhaiensis TaxID=1323731 RepID=A0A853BM95_9ACTN|nr:L-glutamate gamma-semialdehyde dehydrogenase [Streptomonospora nanhaiensis]MBV2362054.1 L-glutamate gamma-semialdehyde dehydrogenase [Streptomonospora nanhaiensis]NYI96120.1 1-pyrroline-5-carboxylate dehydrogenase [Streptomonospora nanhaiensis]
MDAVTNVPTPVNEPVLTYAPGSPERAELTAELTRLAKEPVDLTMAIGGERRMGGGARVDVVQPHKHAHVLGTLGTATQDDARAAIAAAKAAAPAWRAMPFDERAAVLLRAADLLAGPWRQTLNAATMLGQSKTAIQAEIDAACELIDFWRFNVAYARRLMAEQPHSPAGQWNRLEQRPLEGFVYAVTPFNFTAIAGNLPTAPALMGNVVVWKPAVTQQFSAHLLMALLEEAGLPPGVINMVTGDGIAVSEVALADPDLAGVHFTGSTRVFQRFWRTVGENIATYRSYPRIVGETGGKDFVVAHASADPDVVRTAIVRGAFEYQGQKCSAASRAFVARSVWERMRDDLVAEVEALPMGDVTDLSNFLGAVIDRRAYDRLAGVLERVHADPTLTVIAGGTCDDSTGYFVRPTVVVGTDPGNDVFRTEYFGPIVAVHVYDDADYERILDVVDRGSAYALTGAVIANDRAAIAAAHEALRFAAGNFYVNDKPTGSVVGQQPFGGSRASGTNDKAGSAQNLARWTSPRSIKETFVPPTASRHPHQG